MVLVLVLLISGNVGGQSHYCGFVLGDTVRGKPETFNGMSLLVPYWTMELDQGRIRRNLLQESKIKKLTTIGGNCKLYLRNRCHWSVRLDRNTKFLINFWINHFQSVNQICTFFSKSLRLTSKFDLSLMQNQQIFSWHFGKSDKFSKCITLQKVI